MISFEIPIKITPKQLLEITAVFSEMQGTALLYSGGDFDSAESSYLFLFPIESVTIKNEENPWAVLKSRLQFANDKPAYPSWVGFLSYEINDLSLNLSKKIPDAYFQKCAFVLKLDHKRSLAQVFIESVDLEDPFKTWLSKFSDVDFWKIFIEELQEVASFSSIPLSIEKDFETFDSYAQKIEEIKEMIRDGIVYQVNLSHERIFKGSRDPYACFYTLSTKNPAPFSAYFKHSNFTIVSSSPERFLKKEKGLLETRPIKGTIARGKTKAEDLENKKSLLNSEKNLAELMMITDLMRNDLGKVCKPGSVKTIKVAHLEAYSNVFHLLSIIQGVPDMDMHSIDLLGSCFQGGSVTGCPKWTALLAIKQFENRCRGIYTGSIGYFNGNGDFDFNIAIRTILFYEDKIQVSLGGAITIDSDAHSEYLETMQKGESIFQSLT